MSMTTITNSNNDSNNVIDNNNDNDNVQCEQSFFFCFKILRTNPKKGARVSREASSAGARTSEKRDRTLTARINDTLTPTPILNTVLALTHRVADL